MKGSLSISAVILLLLLNFRVDAKTYYVASSGNDNNSGTSTSAPWKTLAKVSSFTGFAAGDQILFNRGDVFYGKLTINNSGASGNPIVFGAYGNGADPVISGFTAVTSWTSLGNNIWESTSAVSSLSHTNMVTVNSVNTGIGRYPNSGYLTYQGYSGYTSITSSSLSGSPNWTGADIVVRKQRWIIDRGTITNQSGGTLTYTGGSTYNGQSGYGFFIENDARTLDSTNEWYFNPSTKKLRIYSVSTPSNVQLATIDTLVYMRYKNYVLFDNLTIQGSNKDAFVILSSAGITIQNCTIDYSGTDAIWGNQNNGSPSSNFILTNSTINHTNNNAINLASEFAGATITNNLIKNTGMINGMAGSGDGTSEAIQVHANNVLVEYNEIDSTGYIGISFWNNGDLIKHNLINQFCFHKLDGAGIYTWVGSGNSPHTGQKVLNNIVLNSQGDNSGTTATGIPISHGIYIDDWCANIEVGNNTTANCLHSGLYIHKAHDLNIHDNVSYNNGLYQLWVVSSDPLSLIRRDTMKNNTFVAAQTSQGVADFASYAEDITSFGAFDYNCYARPLGDNVTMEVDLDNWTKFFYFTLAQWQAYSLLDAHSYKSPKTITNASYLKFVYNATKASQTVTLNGSYIDMKNTTYNGSITLAPYTSAVLIYTGSSTNQSPTANAGSNQTITLPANSATLSGSGTDADGKITAYSWTQVSGPNTATIAHPDSATTLVSGLVQGTYQFQLKVTDNGGATGQSTVNIVVNSTSNKAALALLPAVNPGSVVSGINYSYYESNTGWTTLPDFSTMTPDKTGTLTNFSLAPAAASVTFALNFTGYINVPSDGSYVFYLTSDDGSALYIDGVLVVNNDGLHGAIEKSGQIGLKAGLHAINVEYFQQGGGDSLSVSYNGPTISKTVIPASALFNTQASGLLPAVHPGTTVNGINYNYYQSANGWSSLPNFSTITPAKTGTLNNFSLSPATSTVTFAFSFTGYINVPVDGSYVFYTTSDDGSALYIDGILVVNNNGLHGAVEQSGQIGLQAGLHAINVVYFQQGGGSSLVVNYNGPTISKTTIPNSALYIVQGSGATTYGLDSRNEAVISNEISVKAYPNPFVNSITAVLNGEAGEYKLTLLDALGRIVWTTTGSKGQGQLSQNINTSVLQRGLYFLQVIQNNKSSVFKLDKQ